MAAATTPTEGAEAWAKQRAATHAELKKASRRHALLEDELAQIQQALYLPCISAISPLYLRQIAQIQQALTQSTNHPTPNPDPDPNLDPDH